LKYLQTSKEVLSSLFDLLRSQNLDALKMLHEICVVMKNLEVIYLSLTLRIMPQVDKIAIFRKFEYYGLFEILEEILISNTANPTAHFDNIPDEIEETEESKQENDDEDSKQIDIHRDFRTILEILTLSLIQAPDLFRTYCLSQTQKILKYPFFSFIIENATTHKDPVIQHMV